MDAKNFFLHYCSNSRVKRRDVLDRGELERQRHQRKLFWGVFRKKRANLLDYIVSHQVTYEFI